MTETEFRNWADDHGLSNEVVLSLLKSAALANEDSLVGRTMLDLAEIAEFTDDIVIERCPFDAGFVVFGDCPNGDPIAVDVQKNTGTIHYLSHEESDETNFPSIIVAKSMEHFLRRFAADEMPTDYHEALGWDFSEKDE